MSDADRVALALGIEVMITVVHQTPAYQHVETFWIRCSDGERIMFLRYRNWTMGMDQWGSWEDDPPHLTREQLRERAVFERERKPTRDFWQTLYRTIYGEAAV